MNSEKTDGNLERTETILEPDIPNSSSEQDSLEETMTGESYPKSDDDFADLEEASVIPDNKP